MALAYAKAGASGISISSRTAADLDSVESEMHALAKQHGRPLDILKTVVDVQLDADVQKLEQEVTHRWARVDAIIANAGIISAYVTPEQQTLPAPTAPSNSLTSSAPDSSAGHEASNLPIGLPADDDWARVLNINLLGVWRISKIFLPLLAKSENGAKTLICSTSLAAHSVDSAFTPVAYNVSKIACCRLMEHVANDHGVEGIQA
jgi:NAD(P)-dependent dehydrogenase (short-subunit alcohol dehydrogenase family)